MLKGFEFNKDEAYKYVIYTVLFAFLQTLDAHLRNRVSLMNKYAVYCEINTLEFFEEKDLERRISYDITSTLHLFSYTIPNLFSNIYGVFTEGYELYTRKSQIDVLAIASPFISMFTWRIVDWFKETIMGKKMASAYIDNSNVSELFNTVIDGLTDVQLYNLQQQQMKQFDRLISDEFNSQEDIRYFLNRMYSRFTSRGVLEYLFDVFVATKVMKNRGINHEDYRKIQLDIDHFISMIKRTGSDFKRTNKIIENQNRIINLMNLPNFQKEDEELEEIKTLEKITMKDIQFSYSIEQKPPYALNFKGRVYALIGQNRSGKSTLVHILCKLYKPKKGEIIIDDNIDFFDISRKSLRDLVSYFIFPGTIKENILIGNPDAKIEEIIEAAEFAGIFNYDEEKFMKMEKIKEEKIKEEKIKKTKKILQKSESVYNMENFQSVNTEINNNKDETDKIIEKLEQLQKEEEILNEKIVEIKIEEEKLSDKLVDDIETEVIFEENKNQELNISNEVNNTTNNEINKENNESNNEGKKQFISIDKKKKILDMQTYSRGSNLSGGFQQSVALARIFVKFQSKFIIRKHFIFKFLVDESTSAMDPIKKREITLPKIIEFAKKKNICLIIISHDMNDLKLADHIILLETGEMVCQGDYSLMSQNDKFKKMLGVNETNNIVKNENLSINQNNNTKNENI